MKAATKTTIGQRIVSLVQGKTTLTTRQILTKLNKNKRASNRVSVHGVRYAVRRLLGTRQLVVVSTQKKMFVLKRGKK